MKIPAFEIQKMIKDVLRYSGGDINNYVFVVDGDKIYLMPCEHVKE